MLSYDRKFLIISDIGCGRDGEGLGVGRGERGENLRIDMQPEGCLVFKVKYCFDEIWPQNMTSSKTITYIAMYIYTASIPEASLLVLVMVYI